MATETRIERFRRLTRPARVAGILGWSSFLAAAFATMVCFAFIDPLAIAAGENPAWWGSRMSVYAIGFFFFWCVGLVAAALAWLLAHPRTRRQ
jgi:phosphotransferase system  glucose/maltose/N-acetylglucosamine-specific IIC component